MQQPNLSVLLTTDADRLYREFQQTFEHFFNALCKYAFSFLKDREASEDIVQDVFARIWENRKDLVGTDGIKYYLYTAVRNNCLTHLNKAKRMPIASLSDLDVADQDIAVWAHTPVADNGERVNYKALLERGIERLPPKCKEVFLLSRLGQFNNLEIASNLGVSIKTVNNQLWKAMKMLRTYAKEITILGSPLILYFF